MYFSLVTNGDAILYYQRYTITTNTVTTKNELVFILKDFWVLDKSIKKFSSFEKNFLLTFIVISSFKQFEASYLKKIVNLFSKSRRL